MESSLNHSNIVTIHEIDSVHDQGSDTYFIAMNERGARANGRVRRSKKRPITGNRPNKSSIGIQIDF